ncbi:MAG: ATP synthase subunit a [Parcubacteria group bacterium GW2011_GWA1_47_8]|nr:MAG: ATP synthase subunit a [Parcubacteria group bacterium GW2011_GWA1_47_8]KKW07824.1 MAG: ATP synthase subunit a [Parcubacteria group bacterium GW2011_GWA2_49_16]
MRARATLCTMEENSIHISLAAEKIGTFLGIPITNTLVMSFVVLAILGILAFFVRKDVALIPGRLQTLIETLFVGILDYMTETLEDAKLARKLFPLILTIFLFIFTANLIEFTPGIGSIGWFHSGGEFTPLLRSMNTDLNTTLALTIIAFVAIEVAGVATLGFLRYGKKFVNLSSVLGFMVGIIELFSEVARLVSYSFRLFGNIFAGEVMILVIQHFVPIVLPVPIMAFEVFVGFMQAAIFAILTLFFVKIAITEQAHWI